MGRVRLRLCNDAEDTFDEAHLTKNVGPRQPADLPLADDVHCFISCDRIQRTIYRSEPLTGDDSLLHIPVVLLEDVVHIRRPATLATVAQITRLFQLFNCGRIRRMAIDVDDSRVNAPGLGDCELEKSFRRNRVAIWREQKVDRVSG